MTDASKTKQILSQHGIAITVVRKSVKNINFRIKPNQLSISVPYFVTTATLNHALTRKLPWILKSHAKLCQMAHTVNGQNHRHGDGSDGKHDEDDKQSPNLAALWLWGQPTDKRLTEHQRLSLYRHELGQVMPSLFTKWQPIVGKTANEYRIKKMRTRWGSCNVQARRIWLSAYLPQFPIECTEYVIVHELCHLHHPNHSKAFWQCVQDAMPDYRVWHNKLAGKDREID